MMKRLICLAMCMLLACFAASASAFPWRESQDELEQRARQEWTDDGGELERLLKARTDLEEAIEIDPANLVNYQRPNEVLFALGLYDEANRESKREKSHI